jgi:hypothetical protein
VSYDLRVWCVNEPKLSGSGTLEEGRGWILGATTCGCLPEDIPDQVAEQLPGIRYQVDFTLEPVQAPQKAKTAAWKAARIIAKAGHGVIEDPQEGSVELPSGIKRYVPAKRESGSRISTLELSWWFDSSRMSEPGAIERFLHAAVIGEPYLAAWPELATQAKLEDGLAFVSTPDWRSEADAADLVGGVPGRVALGFMAHKKTAPGQGTWDEYGEELPAVLPFPRPG